MRIVVTSGPSYEPLDKVRRISNFSTGELGTLLAEGFAQEGHQVTCFRGVASTFSEPLWGVEVIPFATNDELEAGLRQLPGREQVNVLFHAAALCDFRVTEIVNERNEPVVREKIPSREGALRLTLEPAPKLIASLRRMFPATLLVGWKYEMDGTVQSVMASGRVQMEDYLTDACVLNGSAYGRGFGLVSRAGELAHLADKAELCRFLIDWAGRQPMAVTTPRPESFHPLATFVPLAPFI
jgi:phosphopantothenoylcysteine synthetase/decarboxylase